MSHRQGLGVKRIDLASAQLGSSGMARDVNRDIVLELVRFHQPVSRARLSRLSGLRRSTISVIVEQLIQERWVSEGAVTKAARGRPSTMLAVNSDKVTFALDIRPDRAILAVINLSGQFLAQETIVSVSEPRKTVALILERIERLRSHFSDKSFEGIGVCVPGRVDPVSQRIVMAPNLKWQDFNLRGALETGTDLQVEIDNDATACLISELWFGRLQGARNVVLIAIAEGLGTSILAGGQLLSGYNGLAGEFGHISVDPRGPLCQCGQRGCWEMMASSRAALHTYSQAKGAREMHNIYDLLKLAAEGNRAAVDAVAKQSRALGRGLRLITASLSPELILIAGDLTSEWERFGPLVQEEMARSMLAGVPPMLRIAGDAQLARLHGSAALLMQRHTRYHRSTHGSLYGRSVPPASTATFDHTAPC